MRTNLVSLTRAQKVGKSFEFPVGKAVEMIGKHDGENIMLGSALRFRITELVGMIRCNAIEQDYVMLNADSDDATKLMHRRTDHVSVGTLQSMQRLNAVDGLSNME